MKQKKQIPYSHQYIDESDIRQVVKILKADFIARGPKIQEFERAICKYTGAKYAVAVSSGTAGLHIACLAAGISGGDEVITSPLTFVASSNCVLYCGGKPVFVDIQDDTANIDPEKIEYYLKTRNSKHENQVKAIIPIHFAGHPCKLKEIFHIAKKHNLIVIEDACHALGSEYYQENDTNRTRKWEKIGDCKYSDMAVFSLHPAKAITAGEGGVVVTNRKDLYEKLIILRSHGITKKRSMFKAKSSTLIGDWYYEMQYLGYNYWITDFQAALALSQLKKIKDFVKKRREIAYLYNKALSGRDDVRLPVEREGVKSAWHLYCIRLRTEEIRKKVFNSLRKQGIGVQVHYIPVYLHPYYKKIFGYREGYCPNAEYYYKRSLSIPIHPKLKIKELRYVVKTLKEILG